MDNVQDLTMEQQIAQCDALEKETYEKIGRLYYAENCDNELIENEYAQLFAAIKDSIATKLNIELKSLVAQGLRKCDSCKKTITIDSIFCNQCGYKLPELPEDILPKQEEKPVSSNCSLCGMEIKSDAMFCPYCGGKRAE